MTRLSFRHHVGLKAVSIGLAFLLWLVVSGEQEVERSFRVPLEFSTLPPQLEILGEPPSVVDVRVRGSSGLVSRVAPADISAVINLQDAKAGNRLFPLTARQIRAPFGLEILQVTPSTVALTLEPSSHKVVPVIPRVEGQPAPGYVVSAVLASPSTVELVGPKSALERVTEAITEPIMVNAASTNVIEDVTVGPPSVAVRLRAPARARVTVTVVHAPLEWSVTEIPVKAVGAAKDVQLLPPVVTVLLRGPQDAFTSAAGDFEASVNVSGLAPGEVLLPVRVVAPERVGVMKVEPAEVRVRVR